MNSYSPPPVHTTSILLHPIGKEKLMGFSVCEYVRVVKWFILTVPTCMWIKVGGENVFVNVCQCAFGMNVLEMHLSQKSVR